MPIDVHMHFDEKTIDNMVTINNKVLVEVFDNRGETKSGIAVPITRDNVFIPNTGIVRKVPKGLETGFKVDDKVLFTEYKGSRVYASDKQYILLDASYILAVVED